MKQTRVVALFTGLLLQPVGHTAIAQDTTVLDERVKIYSFVPLDYPQVARLQQTQGVVVIRVTIDSAGKVTKSVALSGPEKLMAAAVENAKRWRFQTTSDKNAILVYQFTIRGLCQAPCPSQFLFTPPNVATIVIGAAVIDHPPDQ